MSDFHDLDSALAREVCRDEHATIDSEDSSMAFGKGHMRTS